MNVSYCLYGSEPKYFVGAKRNLELNTKLLPDWKTIIYYNSNEISKDFVDGLSNDGAIMIDINNLEISKKVSFQMFWRYFIFEKNEVSIVRDLDSRITVREVEYINRWLDSDKKHFIIRDHPWHSRVPGGLFGIKNFDCGFWSFFCEFVETNSLGWGVDQVMLSKYMENISDTDLSYFGFDDKENYIPRDDKNFFIGIQLDENENPVSPNSTLGLKLLEELSL